MILWDNIRGNDRILLCEKEKNKAFKHLFCNITLLRYTYLLPFVANHILTQYFGNIGFYINS